MRARHLLGAAGAVLAIHACDYPEFQFASGSGASAAAPPVGGEGGIAGGGAAANGGSGNRAGDGPGLTGHGGSGGAMGGAAGAGATGGAGGAPPCRPLDLEGCPAEKCTVVDEVSGHTDCATAGPVAAWAPCNSDADCAAGLWCDYVTRVCKPICVGVGDCQDPATQCIAALSSTGDPIPGLRICLANCNPMDPACGEHANCVYLGDPPLFDCYASLDHGDGDSCVEDADCAARFMCTGDHECRKWCDTPGDIWSTCKTAVWCCSLDPAPSYGGDELGYCDCP